MDCVRQLQDSPKAVWDDWVDRKNGQVRPPNLTRVRWEIETWEPLVHFSRSDDENSTDEEDQWLQAIAQQIAGDEESNDEYTEDDD